MIIRGRPNNKSARFASYTARGRRLPLVATTTPTRRRFSACRLRRRWRRRDSSDGPFFRPRSFFRCSPVTAPNVHRARPRPFRTRAVDALYYLYRLAVPKSFRFCAPLPSGTVCWHGRVDGVRRPFRRCSRTVALVPSTHQPAGAVLRFVNSGPPNQSPPILRRHVQRPPAPALHDTKVTAVVLLGEFLAK